MVLHYLTFFLSKNQPNQPIQFELIGLVDSIGLIPTSYFVLQVKQKEKKNLWYILQNLKLWRFLSVCTVQVTCQLVFFPTSLYLFLFLNSMIPWTASVLVTYLTLTCNFWIIPIEYKAQVPHLQIIYICWFIILVKPKSEIA